MAEFVADLEKGYREYVTSKMGKDRQPCSFLYVNEACKAAQTISGDYDLGIELATDGLAPGYVFHMHGFPTKAVKLGRKVEVLYGNQLMILEKMIFRAKDYFYLTMM